VSQEQESIRIYLWGFIESRSGNAELMEAYGDLTEEFAAMNSTERAMELGFSSQEARDVSSVLRGKDGVTPFEIRQVYLEDIEVNGTQVLFEESNDLADAAAHLLVARDTSAAGEGSIERLRATLAAYDRRWLISRG
jgi:hypothetical protein